MVQGQRGGASGGGKEERMRVTRLTSDFQSIVEQYTDLQKQIVVKMKISLLRPESMTGSTTETEDQDANLIDAEGQKQAQLLLQQELEFEQGMLLEREEKIRQIESDILDVNTIMRELGTLVNEQAVAVGKLESLYSVDLSYL
jgi:t-SNARE complex subunit (syntaxin)